ncbi:hypothetical protein N7447_005521 [Penicillium robsamsonii]|uniref:uncharacterized protein n=1 Tax=Penicillium robsamsonii TaxID=1792511 RepID=UPI002547A738|nr:uncharacterized protein N7447_005521 [Penicillium robsamsonii]KAJ5823181.1 hypothetical protein N7447_005521 [Penicillium robsamsonii]
MSSLLPPSTPGHIHEALVSVLFGSSLPPSRNRHYSPSSDLRNRITHFEEFSQRLVEKSPSERKVLDKLDVWMQVCQQGQWSRSFEGYSNTARALSAQMGENNQAEVAQAWIYGLDDQSVIPAIRVMMATWKEVTVPETITLICQTLGNVVESPTIYKTLECWDMSLSMSNSWRLRGMLPIMQPVDVDHLAS